jgi:phospholipid transport system substrate-binding protein
MPWKEKSMAHWYTRLAVVAILSSVLGVGYISVAHAGEPQEKVRQTVNEVLDILANKTLTEQERQDRMRQAVLQRFSFEEMARRALGQHWRDRKPEEQQEFVQLFTDLLLDSYIDKIERSEGKEDIRYTKESIEEGYATVRTEIVQKRDQNIEVEYRLLQRDGNWQVFDVIIEGVSLVNNYRTQFNKIILEESYAALVKKMQQKSAQLEAVKDAPK